MEPNLKWCPACMYIPYREVLRVARDWRQFHVQLTLESAVISGHLSRKSWTCTISATLSSKSLCISCVTSLSSLEGNSAALNSAIRMSNAVHRLGLHGTQAYCTTRTGCAVLYRVGSERSRRCSFCSISSIPMISTGIRSFRSERGVLIAGALQNEI